MTDIEYCGSKISLHVWQLNKAEVRANDCGTACPQYCWACGSLAVHQLHLLKERCVPIPPGTAISDHHGAALCADCRWVLGQGHYDAAPAIWAAAHTTQFTQPGWRLLKEGAGSGR